MLRVVDLRDEYIEYYFDLKMALKLEPLKGTGAWIQIAVTEGEYWGITIESLSHLASRVSIFHAVKGTLNGGRV